MKKTLFTLMLVFTFISTTTLLGCKKDEEVTPPPTPEQLIIGKWTFKKALGISTLQGTSTYYDVDYAPEDNFDFKADGTVSIYESKIAYSGKWKIVNNKLFLIDTKYMDYPSGLDLQTLNTTDLVIFYKEIGKIATLELTLKLAK